jgi:hypothetical protein
MRFIFHQPSPLSCRYGQKKAFVKAHTSGLYRRFREKRKGAAGELCERREGKDLRAEFWQIPLLPPSPPPHTHTIPHCAESLIGALNPVA